MPQLARKNILLPVMVLLSAAFLGLAAFLSARVLLEEKSSPARANESTKEPVKKPSMATATLPVSDKALRSQQLMDPHNDGWPTEVFAEWTKTQLKKVLQAAAASADLGDLVSDSQGQSLRPAMSEVYQDGTLVVRRANAKSSTASKPIAVALTELVVPVTEVGEPKFFVKVIGVDLSSDLPRTTCLYEAVSAGHAGLLQQTAKLECTWSNATDDAKLISVVATELEETQREANSPWFVDCTESALTSEPSHHQQLKRGYNYWWQRIERAHGMDDSVRTGLAIGDANGDGLEDVYLCQGPGLPNKLLIHQPNGTVVDHSAQAGVDWLDQTSAALFVDLDNDGDQDLAIATTGGVLLMDNDGSARYRRVATLTPQLTDVQSLTAADYDLDGDLDLSSCALIDTSPASPNPSLSSTMRPVADATTFSGMIFAPMIFATMIFATMIFAPMLPTDGGSPTSPMRSVWAWDRRGTAWRRLGRILITMVTWISTWPTTTAETTCTATPTASLQTSPSKLGCPTRGLGCRPTGQTTITMARWTSM